jgi:ribosome-associated heat shock protein Hsp15
VTEGELAGGPESVRLDVWLDVACIFSTRSQAKTACDGGKVDVNGHRAKPHREIRIGDRLSVTAARGRRRELLVRGLAQRSLPKREARRLYEDVTPAPSPEAIEVARLDRLLATDTPSGRPGRREQRERRKRKGW